MAELRETLNLPQTDFPMRAGLPKREPEWIKRWEQEDIYQNLRKISKQEGRKPFILHCGPPYANGNLHMGHAMNMALKDFVVRSKQMLGYDAIFTPGWDCHGLPIEWKVEQDFRAQGKAKADFSISEIRDKCRAFAKKWVDVQVNDSRRFGVLADLNDPYLTMNQKNEAGILRELGKMAAKGLLYKGAKSVMWSTVEETSLAEAETEYADKESIAIYVKFDLQGTDEAVVIWTTTPWTMPANRAVAYAKDAEYVLVEATDVFEKATAKVGDKVWVAKDLLEEFTKMVGFTAYTVVKEQLGSAFEGKVAVHPFYNRPSPLVEGFHVTTDAGTGFVHTAPSHGAEDFEIGKQFGLDLECHVNGDGTYDEAVNALPLTNVQLTGQVIWDAQKAIVEEMTQSGALMRWYKFKHSYPVSWRSKAPLIFRTVPQWFVALDKEIDGKSVRQIALSEISKIGDSKGWVPAYGQNRITAMMEGRPDWCVSRQRAWGVPIAIFKNTKTNEYTFEAEVFEHIASLFETHGMDVWEEWDAEKLLPEGYLAQKGWDIADLEKETDILDVWFDSGTTYAHVVEEKMGQTLPADLYLEGSDQHRGWFNSSLTACSATRGYAPYKQVLTHGFVVDGEGRKFSKSLGNGVEPKDLLDQYGMDIIRLWVATSDYQDDVRYSDEIMKGTADAYRRYRNSFRFMLGNLYDFDENEHAVDYDDLPELEQWVLSKFAGILKDVQKAYSAYQFRKVFELTHNFCAKELSNLYFDIRKDSLYCDPRTEMENDDDFYYRRRSCQTVLSILLKGLTTHLAPIMPFTTDEVWRLVHGENAQVHLEQFSKIDDAWHQPELEADWVEAWNLRDLANLKIEELRQSGRVRANLEVAVELFVSEDRFDWAADKPWDEILVVSEAVVSMLQDPEEEVADIQIRVLPEEGYVKCARSWQYMPQDEMILIEDGSLVTPRDALALQAIKNGQEAA